MAHVAGVPKREPCQKCGFPVFLAERLTVGQSLYHRKCLRCARCASQLTLGSFYETETDGVFCCETCPDEERSSTKIDDAANDVKSPAQNEFERGGIFSPELRASFNEKLAMFQNGNNRSFLQKALSDEEKSESLKRMSEFYESQLRTTADVDDVANTAHSDNETDVESDSESSDEENEVPPPLPSTEPPIDEIDESKTVVQRPPIPSKVNALNKLNGSPTINRISRVHDIVAISSVRKAQESNESQTKRNSVESLTSSHLNEQEEISTNCRSLEKVDNANSCKMNVDETNASDELKTVEVKDDCIDGVAAMTAKDDAVSSSSENVTKEADEDTETNENCSANDNNEEVVLRSSSPSVHPPEDAIDESDNGRQSNDSEINNRSTIVRSRLSHFEALAQHDDTIKMQRSSANVQISVVDENEKQMTSEDNDIEVPSVEMNNDKNQLSVEVNDNEENERPVPMKRTAKDSSLPPTPMRRKNRSPVPTLVDDASKATEIHLSTEMAAPTAEEKQPKTTDYPIDLNPFGSDDEEKTQTEDSNAKNKKKDNLNPFDSSDDEVELMKNEKQNSPKNNKTPNGKKGQRVSTNPFGSDTEDDEGDHNSSMASSVTQTPRPTPRKSTNGSMQSTPEPSPRMARTLQSHARLSVNRFGDDMYGSSASLSLSRCSQMHGSMSSLSSTPRHRKGKAPPIPKIETPRTPQHNSNNSSPSSSHRATPMSRKKRPAPKPPKFDAPAERRGSGTAALFVTAKTQLDGHFDDSSYTSTVDSNHDTSIDSGLVSKHNESDVESVQYVTTEPVTDDSISLASTVGSSKSRKLIPIDASLLDDMPPQTETHQTSEEKIYRRTIAPAKLDDTPQKPVHDRQWEKMKENKESMNKTRQTQNSPSNGDSELSFGLTNKSSFGKWKRRKGPAPALPVPQRKVLQMLPLQEIRHELEVIEVQQQGLEKQGVMLEKMIRERCEGGENENTPVNEFKPNTKEVEDLILQLFELVNEKNELFRRQAELMYLRRQHRLEQEQADIEYEIRLLMAQPECNKTDSDKTREEALISRLVDIVQLRNEVIESLEMDRLREAEEDHSIKTRMEMHTAKRDAELSQQTPTKLSKKEKKKQKEAKKLAKQKKVDADKDADESEMNNLEANKEKKKKKKFLF